MNKKLLGTALTFVILLGSLVGASPANATASAGASVDCDLTGVNCVTGAGQSENGGSSVTGGYATAVCHGGSNGALLMEVSCSVAGYGSTTALPGPTGAAVVVAPTDTLLRQPVCWTVTGFFLHPLGGVNDVTTQGCSIVSL